MTAAATYVLKSATFDSQAVDGLQDIQTGEEGDMVSHAHDALETITASFVDNIKGTVRLLANNSSWFTNAKFRPGHAGSLVMVWQKRAEGRGAAAGEDLTITAAHAVVGRSSGGAPHAGQGSFEVEFECADPDGDSPFAFT